MLYTTVVKASQLLLHPFNCLFSRTTWVCWFQKGKTSLDLNEATQSNPLIFWPQSAYGLPHTISLLRQVTVFNIRAWTDKLRNVTSDGWQVTLSAPVWHLNCHSSDISCKLLYSIYFTLPSVLWDCWLGVRKSIRLVKTSDEVLVRLSVWSKVQIVCIWPADATASQNPIISCLILIQTGFTLLVPAYPGCPGKQAIKCSRISSSSSSSSS